MNPSDPTDFSALVSDEHRLNATLIEGHQVCAVISQAGYRNPRLFAEPKPSGSGATLFIPEVATQSPDQWEDTSRDLTTMGVPQDLPIALFFVVDDVLAGNPPGIERNVAQASVLINANNPIYGMQAMLAQLSYSAGQPVNPTAGATVAFRLPGVMPAVKAALKALAKPR
jgi:hypothetical protein